jgi:FeS assembly SUF system protein
MNTEETELNIVKALKQVYDPEIPVNIYDLGLIYNISVNDAGRAEVVMTLTAPNCPLADELVEQVHDAVADTPGVADVGITLTFEPPWDSSSLSDEAKLELGLL